MLKWLKRWFGMLPEKQQVHQDNPYLGVILNEVMRTGGMVMGNVDQDGNLTMISDNGKTIIKNPAPGKESDSRDSGK